MTPPPRRRSARLASAVKTKAVPDLSSVVEGDETPTRGSSKNIFIASTPVETPATPASSGLKPPRTEMHPSKFHITSGEPSSALRLGFSDITVAKRRDSSHGSGIESTPSKRAMPSSPFSFRVTREAADSTLSSNAQRIMDELRGEAAKIKADLVAQREADHSSATGERPFAKPKGKSGRFSAAHMAEFKKMDSIEGHASAWRAQNGRFTPVKGLKRTQSKANLNGTPTSNSQQTPQKAEETPNTRAKSSLKRTSSAADLDTRPPSPKKLEIATTPAKPEASYPVKRIKQRAGDDASTTRPVSRDDSAIPRPMFSARKVAASSQRRPGFGRMPSPVKPSTAPSTTPSKPTVSLVVPSPKASVRNLAAAAAARTSRENDEQKVAELKKRVISPGRFEKVKSILRSHKLDLGSARTAIPHPAVGLAQTPAPPRLDKALPPVPLTTPRKKLTKHVTFTPDTARAAVAQDTPSPHKSASKAKSLFRFESNKFEGIDNVLVKSKSGDVVYPDLSGFKHIIESDIKSTQSPTPSVPGTFTFRSDHTIELGTASTTGFGGSAGQSSLRHVRGSTKPVSDMPGSFPELPSPSTHPNKENKAPSPTKLLAGAPHGMANKKRHRASSDDEDTEKEAAERAGKKRKNEHVPQPEASVSPYRLGTTPSASAKKARVERPLGHTPGRAPVLTPAVTGSATPSKKRPMLSMSRLNMLARPKNRA